MRKFKFRKDEIVSFTVVGEKHMGQIISGGVYAPGAIHKTIHTADEEDFIVYYCVDDLKDSSMWKISEDELEKSSQQEIVDRLTKAFSDSIFSGYNPFEGGNNGFGY